MSLNSTGTTSRVQHDTSKICGSAVLRTYYTVSVGLLTLRGFTRRRARHRTLKSSLDLSVIVELRHATGVGFILLTVYARRRFIRIKHRNCDSASLGMTRKSAFERSTQIKWTRSFFIMPNGVDHTHKYNYHNNDLPNRSRLFVEYSRRIAINCDIYT